jgi:hypothetical protein
MYKTPQVRSLLWSISASGEETPCVLDTLSARVVEFVQEDTPVSRAPVREVSRSHASGHGSSLTSPIVRETGDAPTILYWTSD